MSDGNEYQGNYEWSSLDTGVVTCSNADTGAYLDCGHVCGVAVGTAYIAVTLDDGSTWAAYFTLTENTMDSTSFTQLGKITLSA